jgi:hypothetical protein
MHPTIRRARPAAALTLVLAVTLVVPGAALATTTQPTPTTTSTPVPTTTTSSTTTSAATSPPPTTSTTATDQTTAATSATTASDPTQSPSTTTDAPSKAAGSATARKLAASSAQVPFGARSSLRAALVPGESRKQARQAGGFIVRTLKARGNHYNYPASTFFDGGNTIDAVLALDGAKVGSLEADATTGYLADHVNDYIGYRTPTDPQETYAGPTAKALLAVVAQGGDPKDFGGENLVTRLKGLMSANGRFSDASQYGDYSNTIGQALAVIALGRATGSVPDVAGDYLLDQQCANGGFRGNLNDAGAPCTADLDATAFAAQALVGLLGTDDSATTKALAFLSSQQGTTGGIDNSEGVANANTTGVAAQAFAAGGQGWTLQLARAQKFIASLQFDCSFPAALRGGIAFTAADFTATKKDPASQDLLDKSLRATPQATLGLAGGSLLTVTADGAQKSAPTPSCPASTTTTSTTTTATATTKPAATTATATQPAAPAPSATPGNLAFTGSNVTAMLLLAVIMLLAGAASLVLARRKGAHA